MLMKNEISIITPHSVYNYGAMLQAYGIYQFIKKNGYDVGVYEFPVDKEKIRSIKGFIYTVIEKFFRMIHYSELKEGDHAFDDFILRYQINKDDQSKVYIVGSDQVWNPNNINPYFSLKKFTNTYKFSYAASLGVSEISAEQKGKYDFLKDMKQISVREKTAVNILENMFGCKAEVNIDPSFLLEDEEWRKIEKKPQGIPEEYILVYILHIPNNINEVLNELKKKLNKKIVLIDRRGYLNKIVHCDNVVRNAGPSEFLWLIDHAQFIVTSSFHGTAFSLIFQKPFCSLVNPNAPSRINYLLKLMEIKKRENERDELTMEIDYEKVKAVIKNEREKSYRYIVENLKEAGINGN